MEISRIEQRERGQCIVLYGPANAGKTYQLGYLPPDETLLLDIDGGIVTLMGTGIHVVQVKEDLSTLAEIYEFLRVKDHPFKYVAVDNFSELERFMLQAIGKQRNVEFWRQLEWSNTAQKLREYMRLFRDLTDRNINVIFIAWDMVLDTDDGPRVCPQMMRSVTGEFSGLADNVWYLKPDPNIQSSDRYLITQSTANIIAKTRVPKGEENPLPKIIKNPSLIECIKKLEPFYKSTLKKKRSTSGEN